MPRIDTVLEHARQLGGSDVHFSVGSPPLVRLHGELIAMDAPALDMANVQDLVLEVLPVHLQAKVARSGAADFSHVTAGGQRFRFNVLSQRTGLGAVCRIIPGRVPRLSDLGLPAIASRLTSMRSGLVLVTGGVGAGKSTTLAALIHEINSRRAVNIVTLEDPVEFVHENLRGAIAQREVGTHVASFSDGLRAALRQDPDVIMVGELRDPESIALAVEASETGHLVLGTVHTRGAYQTIHRIVDAFPADQQEQIRHTVAENLRVVLSQQLVRAADGQGRRAATEVLVVTTAVGQMIREGKTHQIPSAIATSKRAGMQSMDQSLLELVMSGEADAEDAFVRATDKKEFGRFVTRDEFVCLIQDAK